MISVFFSFLDIYFLLLSLGRYLCWWTISPNGIIRPVVNILALTWFIRYIFIVIT